MQPETEQIFATLELLLEQNLPFNLPGHEDGGRIFPFVWDVSEQGEFNILNLCCAKSWLKLTDVDATIKSWQEMNYARSFPDFSLNSKQITTRVHQIESLFQVLNTSLHNLESYILNSRSSYYVIPFGVVIGRTEDKDWICVSPTVYTETHIPKEQISRSPLFNSTSAQPLGEKTLNILSRIQAITSELGTISLNGDFDGYSYAYDHQIISAAAATKELALEQALQASGMLEISQFNGLYREREYLQGIYCDDEINETHQKYKNINKFLNQNFSKVVMYRLSFWTEENIYIIGQTSCGDWAGIYLNSQFVYNP